MRTDELIVRLVSEAGPVPQAASVRWRFVTWTFVSVPAVATLTALFGARPDVTTRLADPGYAFSLAVVGALALTAAALAIVTSVPDDRRPRALRALPVTIAAVWGGVLAGDLATETGIVAGIAADSGHFWCALQIAVMALAPGLALGRAVRAGSTIEPGWTGAWVAMAAAAAGAAGMAVICPIDLSAHQLLWHFLPVAALGTAGVFVGRRWLDRFAR